jgi:hypothetical protein
MFVDQAFEGGAWLSGRKCQAGRPSTYERNLQHQNHVKMNAHILRNAMVVQR